MVPKTEGIVRPSSSKSSAGLTISYLLLSIIIAADWAGQRGMLSAIHVYSTQTFLLDVSYVAFLLGASQITAVAGQFAEGYISDKLGRTRILKFSTGLVLLESVWVS